MKRKGGCLFAIATALVVCAGSVVQAAACWNSPFVGEPARSAYKDVPVEGNANNYKWGDLKPCDYGPLSVTYEVGGLRSLPKLPPAGVHPRILFTGEQLPDLRRRFRETKVGQHMWNAVVGWTEEMKGRYDDRAAYAQPDLQKGMMGTHGFIPKFRAIHLKKGEVYKALAAGRIDLRYPDMDIIWGLFPLEALRCLVEQDEDGGRILGKAIDTAVRSYQTEGGRKNYSKYGIQDFNAAYTYDLAYKWLSPGTRRFLHDYIIKASAFSDHFGAFNPATTSVSNWATFTYPLVGLLAVEGEQGFNDLKYLGMLRAWHNFFSYGWYQSGACFEGMGKNQLGGDALVMFALRGDFVAGHPHALAMVRERIPREVIPGDTRYFQYDRWGGLKRINTLDAMAMKYLYPSDKAVDFTFRKAIGWGEPAFTIGGGRVDMYWNTVLVEAILADDPPAGPLSQEEAAAGKKTFFCGERNLFTTRSGWEDDALLLNFQARPFNGGHVFADRNTVHFVGKGVNWLIKRPIAYHTDQNNVVQIDSLNQCERSPARMVDLEDNEKASFVVGDAKYTWSWELSMAGTWQNELGISPWSGRVPLPPGTDWIPVMETSTDFSYRKTSQPYLNRPIHFIPRWDSTAEDDLRLEARRKMLPVEKAFRTAGIVRGEKGLPSYGFVMDDIKVDGQVHTYDWLGQLDDTMRIWKIEESAPGVARPCTGFTRDLYLFQAVTTNQVAPTNGQPVLLVRALDMTIEAGKTFADVVALREVFVDPKTYQKSGTISNGIKKDPVKEAEVLRDPRNKGAIERRLVLTSRSVQPNFKVMLYPFILGKDLLPVTTWNWWRTVMKIDWPNTSYTDRMEFPVAENGKVNVIVRRDDKIIAKVDKTVPPSPDRAPPIDAEVGEVPIPVMAWNFATSNALSFRRGSYARSNAVVSSSSLVFDNGQQQVDCAPVRLQSNQDFTVAFQVKTAKVGPCNIIHGDGWSFSLGSWNAIVLQATNGVASVRKTEMEIKDWFMSNWAHVVIVKRATSWSFYLNGKLMLFVPKSGPLPAGTLDVHLGDAANNPSYGMIGGIRDLCIYDRALTFAEVEALGKTEERHR